MVLEKAAFEEQLDEFVDKYILFKLSLDADNEQFDEKEMTRILNDYMEVSDDLLEFIRNVYNEDDAQLPDMEAFYSENTYHGFAYRLYSASYKTAVYSADEPDEEWRMYMLYYIGERLHNIYRG